MSDLRRAPLVARDRTIGWIADYVSSIVEARTPLWWWIAFAITGALTLLLGACTIYLLVTGVGVWGNNHPVGWGWDITNFVFWIGIGHAGTLISAVLYLTRQKWRTSIHRAAEAMTLFAVMCAAIYPIIHLGRAWMVWFLIPVPNSNDIWQNFRSPLLWDTFAIGTYFTVSLLFCYTGLLPDLAALRDRATTRGRQFAYGLLALGWRGSQRQWRHYGMAYLLLAGLSTPLVLSVHSVVSFDFAATVIPGWHATIFPPYFVAGAIFGGFAMVLTLLIPACAAYPQLRDLITPGHIDKMCKVLLFTGCLVGYAYGMELFTAWYSGDLYERAAYWLRLTGPYSWAFAGMVICNVLVPQLLWFRAIRTNLLLVWFIVLFPNVGMWLERFVIVATTLSRDFLPSSWALFQPTTIDICTFAGTVGFFVFLFLLFIRFLPMVCMYEVKALAVPGESTPIVRPESSLNDQPGNAFAAEFATPAAVTEAAKNLRAAGFRHFDIYSPFPIPGMNKVMGLKRSPLGLIVFAAGVCGVLAAFALQFIPAWIYPIIVAGRSTDFSTIPALIPIVFETTILFSAITAFAGLLLMNGLPRWHHPLFGWDAFRAASADRFFLVLEAADPKFEEARGILESLAPQSLTLLHDEP